MVDALSSCPRRDRDEYDPATDPLVKGRDATSKRLVEGYDHLAGTPFDPPPVDCGPLLKNKALHAAAPRAQVQGPLGVPVGIEAASLATVPPTIRDDPAQKIVAPPYELHAQIARRADGSEKVAHFTAFNRETGQVDYIVQPGAVQAFAENVLAYKTGANVTTMFGAPTRDYEKESVRGVDTVMRGEVLEGFEQVARANLQATRDPVWYLDIVKTAATAFAPELSPASAVRAVAGTESEIFRTESRAARGLPFARTENGARSLGGGKVGRSVALGMEPRPALRIAPPSAGPKPKVSAPTAPLVLDAERKTRVTPDSSPRSGARTESTDARRDDAIDECDPHPLGWHRGEDAIHNACAEVMCANVHPGSDYVVAGKAFDGVSLSRDLCEVKTGLMSKYSPQVVGYAFEAVIEGADAEKKIADHCGYHFVLYIADPAAIPAIRERLHSIDPTFDVRPADEDACVR